MSLLGLHDVSVRYRLAGGATLTAIDRISLEVASSETLAIVGESGCGKSSLGRAVIGLTPLAAGSMSWRGQDIATLDPAARGDLKRSIQIIFQDPLASLDPRMSVAEAVAEPLAVFEPRLSRAERWQRVARMLDQVELPATVADRLPHAISGGQCQRVAIARAMILAPDLLVCDEAVSALDVSVQAQIVNLLQRLQRDTGLSLLFISHGLSVVRHLSRRVAVLYLGRVVETGPVAAVFAAPAHPYTRALLSAVPIPDPVAERGRHRIILTGEPPSPTNPPSGCVFRTRCPEVMAICAEAAPIATSLPHGGQVSCHRHEPSGQAPAPSLFKEDPLGTN
jgi:oligopeptide transport system ATP-binding protein